MFMCRAVLWLGCIDGSELAIRCRHHSAQYWQGLQADSFRSPAVHRGRFFRINRILRAFCLGVTGFTNPPIGDSLIARHAQQVFGAFGIGDLESRAAIVAEIELGKVAMQMSFAALQIFVEGRLARSIRAAENCAKSAGAILQLVSRSEFLAHDVLPGHDVDQLTGPVRHFPNHATRLHVMVIHRHADTLRFLDSVASSLTKLSFVLAPPFDNH